jgi:hypothetical protein
MEETWSVGMAAVAVEEADETDEEREDRALEKK